MFIKNNAIDLMIKMENVIGKNCDKIFGKNHDKVIKCDTYEIDYDCFIDYMNLIEKIINNKKVLSNRSNNYNKSHKEYHKIINCISQAKISNNQERYNYWKNKLEEYKKGE